MALEGGPVTALSAGVQGRRETGPHLRAQGVQHPLHQALKWGGLIPQLHSSPQGYVPLDSPSHRRDTFSHTQPMPQVTLRPRRGEFVARA